MKNMNEDYPTIILEIGDETFEATPFNTRLYTFVGRTVLENGDTIDLSTRNHVYHAVEQTETEDGRGIFIFDREVVRNLGAMMLQKNFPASLFNWTVPEGDEQAYQRWLARNEDKTAKDIGDYIPEGWGDE